MFITILLSAQNYTKKENFCKKAIISWDWLRNNVDFHIQNKWVTDHIFLFIGEIELCFYFVLFAFAAKSFIKKYENPKQLLNSLK